MHTEKQLKFRWKLKISKFWKQKTREGKEIFGWKKKSKERNWKNEASMKTETLKFTVKWNKSETTTPVGVKENQGNYQKGRQRQGKVIEKNTVTGQPINYQYSGIMGNHHSLPVWQVKVEEKPVREEQTLWFDKLSSSELSSLKRFWSCCRKINPRASLKTTRISKNLILRNVTKFNFRKVHCKTPKE